MAVWLLITLTLITAGVLVFLFAPLRLQLDYSFRERRSSFVVRVSWLHQAFIRGDYCSADDRLRMRFLFWRFDDSVDTGDASDENRPSTPLAADSPPHVLQQTPHAGTNARARLCISNRNHVRHAKLRRRGVLPRPIRLVRYRGKNAASLGDYGCNSEGTQRRWRVGSFGASDRAGRLFGSHDCLCISEPAKPTRRFWGCAPQPRQPCTGRWR